MSRADLALDRLMPALSARERAVLVFQASFADEAEDPAIRSTMPRDQVAEFNRFIGLGNGVLHVLLPHALVLCCEIDALWLRYGLLLALGLATQTDSITRLGALRTRVRGDLIACRARLLAQQLVGAETEHEFADPDAMPQEWRDLMAEARARLEALRADAATQFGRVKWPVADEATIARLREGIRNQLP